MKTTLRAVALAAALVVLTSGCYLVQVDLAESNGEAKPWFCNPIAPNSVTGPGMGTVDFYAGQTRSELSWEDCRVLGAQMDVAKDFAERYPTAADAEAAGYDRWLFNVPGMGTHHGDFGGLTSVVNAPGFDRFDPILPGTMSDTFNPAQPEFLQYDGNGPAARLVGMSWYVRTTTGQPPEGFVGGNDWWHHHPIVCMSSVTGAIISVNQSDPTCDAQGGVNVHLDDYYMVHLWVVDDLEYHADAFAPTHRCITPTGAIRDMGDPCHTSALPGATASTAGTEVPAFCSLGLLAPDPAST